MNVCLKVGNLEFTGELLVAAMARYQMLETFISNVILDSLLNKINIDPQDVYQTLEGGDGTYRPDDFNQFISEWSKRNRVAIEYLKQVVFRQIRIEKLKREQFDCHIGSEFLRRKSEFDQVEFSLIRTADPLLAQAIYFQIRDDSADFGHLAQKYSTGSERETQGWMGPMRMSELPIAIQGLLKDSSRIVREPVLISNEYWIVRLEQSYLSRMTMQVRHELREQIFSSWLKSQAKKVMSDPEKVQLIASLPGDKECPCLRVGNLEFTGKQIVAAMARYQMSETFISNVILDSVIKNHPLSEQEAYQALEGGDGTYRPDDFNQFIIEWASRHQLSDIYVKQVVLRQVQIDKLKRKQFDCHIGSEFLRRKSEFDQVEFSLIRTADPLLAQAIYFQIRDDSVDFGRLARKYSTGAERYTKGWMGPMRMSELPSAVQSLLRESSQSVRKPGLISNEYWIVRRERFFPSRMTMQVRNELREQIFSRWLKAQAKDYMSNPEKVQLNDSQAQTAFSLSVDKECA